MKANSKRKAGGRFAGAPLLGVILKRKCLDQIQTMICEVQAKVAACLDWEQSAYFLLGIANHIPTVALVTPNCPWQQHMRYRKSLAWWNDDTLAISHLEYNHPENGGDASGNQLNLCANEREISAASKSTNLQKRRRKLWLMLGLAAGVYLPVYPLWLISRTPLQPPMILLLATQGWITLAGSLLSLSLWGSVALTPNRYSGRNCA